MEKEFGSELGLVHEAVITGRKVNAGTRFWNALAESENTFRMMVSVTQHAALLEQHGIAPNTIPSESDITEFASWIMRLFHGCTCQGPQLEDYAELNILPEGFASKGKEDQDRILGMLREDAFEQVLKIAAQKLAAMSMDISELRMLGVNFGNGPCFSQKKLAEALLRIREERIVIAKLSELAAHPFEKY
jgi:hypothetical protein